MAAFVQAIAKERQNNTPINTVIKSLNKHMQGYGYYTTELVLWVYEEMPAFRSEKYQQEAIKKAHNDAFIVCMRTEIAESARDVPKIIESYVFAMMVDLDRSHDLSFKKLWRFSVTEIRQNPA